MNDQRTLPLRDTTLSTSPASSEKLWPQPIEVIGVTGEYASGKTLFAVTVSPGDSTKIYDTEKSSGSYESLGFDRVSVPDRMLEVKPNGYKPIDLFEWWWADVKNTPRGKYKVIAIDTISEIEDGLVEWVQKNPTYFGHTSGQYAKMSGVMWGDVKNLWKAVLNDLAARCETFVFVAHMANVWQGDRPTGKRKPKGKETLFELASLYLLMERKVDDKGVMPAAPAATVLKSRLVHTRFDLATKKLELSPCLPPRLPEATPEAIIAYMKNPPNYKKLKASELVREDKMSDDELAMLSLQKAEAERDAERMKLERVESHKRMLDEQKQQGESDRRAAALQQKAAVAATFPQPAWPGEPAAPAATVPAPASESLTPQVAGPRPEQMQELVRLKGAVGDAVWNARLASLGVAKAKQLEPDAAAGLIDGLKAYLAAPPVPEEAPAEAPGDVLPA